jgi:hypothetical protein
MTTDTYTVRPPGFYDSELYVDDIEYITVEDAKPLPSLDRTLLTKIAIGVQTSVAAVAVAGLLTIAVPAYALSEPPGAVSAAVAQPDEPDKPLDLRAMTGRMRQHAGFAERLFQRTPHPGADEPDPDYGL